MSSSEAPAAEAPKTEIAPTETPAIAPETVILTKDPQVVEANLAKAEPVANPAEATQETPATAEATAPAATEEEAGTQAPAAQTAEHKEGSTLLNFLKKHIPNPKDTTKKPAASGKAVETTEAEAAPAAAAASTSEAAPTEPVEEGPFEGGDVLFKTHGGLFGYEIFSLTS